MVSIAMGLGSRFYDLGFRSRFVFSVSRDLGFLGFMGLKFRDPDIRAKALRVLVSGLGALVFWGVNGLSFGAKSPQG